MYTHEVMQIQIFLICQSFDRMKTAVSFIGKVSIYLIYLSVFVCVCVCVPI